MMRNVLIRTLDNEKICIDTYCEYGILKAMLVCRKEVLYCIFIERMKAPVFRNVFQGT